MNLELYPKKLIYFGLPIQFETRHVCQHFILLQYEPMIPAFWFTRARLVQISLFSMWLAYFSRECRLNRFFANAEPKTPKQHSSPSKANWKRSQNTKDYYFLQNVRRSVKSHSSNDNTPQNVVRVVCNWTKSKEKQFWRATEQRCRKRGI